MPKQSRNPGKSLVLQSFLGECWAMRPEKLEEIGEFLDRLYVRGEEISDDELLARFGETPDLTGRGSPSMRGGAEDDDGHPVVDGVQVIDCLDVLAPRMNLVMRYSGGTSTERMRERITAATKDDRVQVILIRGDSPGGAATHVPEVAAALAAAAAAGKRTVAHFKNDCCSGAFWIGAACQELYCSLSTNVGSHGVYWIHRSDMRRNQADGRQYTVVKAGENKVAGNPYEDLTAASRAVIQERIDAHYTSFTRALARGRGVSEQVVLDTFGQGTTFLADEARRRGMIDGVANFEDVLTAERERRPARHTMNVSQETAGHGVAATNGRAKMLIITNRIRAALFARGLIASQNDTEISDDHCRGVLSFFGVVSGTESQVLSAINSVSEPVHQYASDGAGVGPQANLAGQGGPSEPARINTGATPPQSQPGDWQPVSRYQFETEPQAQGQPRDPNQDPAGTIRYRTAADGRLYDPLQFAGSGPQPAQTGQGLPASGDGNHATAGARQLLPSDYERARDEGRREEQSRREELSSRGQLLGLQQADIDQAIEQGLDPSAANDFFVEQLANRQRPSTLRPATDVVTGAAAADKFCEAASEMLLVSAGGALSSSANQEPIRQYGQSLRFKRPIDLARMEMSIRGMSATGDSEFDATQWLQMGGLQQTMLAADGGSVNSAGAHPDLLSSLVNKAFNRAYPIASVKFKSWCHRMEDLPDLKPKAIIETGVFNELDHLDDDQTPDEKRFDSQLASWMQAHRFGARVGLTPVMVANDDMGGFMRQLGSLSGAAPRTLNRMCLDLLAGNVVMIDGTPLFHADHNNLIDTGSGGVPSAAQAAEMRTLHRLQTNVPVEGAQIELDEPPSISLHPAAHENAAKQTFMRGVYDSKVANVDDEINTMRGEISPIITARLDAYSDLEWYTLVDPNMIATIAYAYQRGWGEMGRRTTWFEPGPGTRYYRLEARFTCAAISWRGACKNAGA